MASAAVRSIFRSSSAQNAADRLVSAAKNVRRSPLRTATQNQLSRRALNLRFAPEFSFCVESLLPYHTATASALLNSMLSVSAHSYGWICEACIDDN